MNDRAQALHKQAWTGLVERARGDASAKYGLYASRTLAVRHPEAYLIGDSWFHEGANSIKGFKEAYEEPTSLGWSHMHYGGEFAGKGEDYRGIPDGHPLFLDGLSLDKYRVTNARRIYPEPYFPLLDQRLGPLPLTLKAEGKVVTSLELAEIAYFKAKEAGQEVDRMFIVYCKNERSYLSRGNELFSAELGRPVAEVEGEPLLIFNEQVVWYPLMGRDDRENSTSLAHVVDRLAAGESVQEGEPWQLELIDSLVEVTALDSPDQLSMAALAAVRAGGWRFHPYSRAWKQFVPDADLNIDISRHLGIVREFDIRANSISPATAYLTAVMGEGPVEEQMRRLSQCYLMHTAVVREAPARGWKPAWRLESWGHLWPCGLMEHTIDDAFRSRTGHCVSQAHMLGGVLEMAGVPHVVVNFDRGGVKDGVNHHFILSRDGKFLVDDGIVNFRGIDPPTEDYGPLLSFTIQGEWASTVGDKLYGNIPSARVAEWIEVIDTALAGRFDLRFFADEAKRQVVGKDEFLRLLRGREVEIIGLP